MSLAKKIAIAAWCVAASAAHAALIDQGSFTTDSVSGLDWLDVSGTLGLSYNEVMAGNYIANGWRYATSDEVLGLFDDAGADSSCYVGCNSQQSYVPARQLTQLLGHTYDATNDSGATRGVMGLMNASVFAGTHNVAQFQFNEYFNGSSPNTGFFVPDNGGLWDYFSAPTVASFLVRETASNVPEPGSAALVAAALAAVALGRKVRIVAIDAP